MPFGALPIQQDGLPGSILPVYGQPKAWTDNSQHRAAHRCLHHHVFDLDLMASELAPAGWEVDGIERVRPLRLLALDRRPPAPEKPSPSGPGA